MYLNLKKTESGFTPIGEESVNAYNRIKLGEEISPEFKPKRNMKFHRKYFALLNAVLLNQEHFKSVDNLHEAVKYRAGYYETIFTTNGDKLIVTKSIAFHVMDGEAFAEFLDIALDVCLELMPEESLNEIIKFL